MVRVLVTVDRAAAILAGHEQWGDVSVEIALAGCSEAERVELAGLRLVDGGLDACDKPDKPDGYYGHEPDGMPAKPVLAVADEAGVRAVLAWRPEYRAAYVAAIADLRAKQAADVAEMVAAWLAKPDEECLEKKYWGNGQVAWKVLCPFSTREGSPARAKEERLEGLARAREAEAREREEEQRKQANETAEVARQRLMACHEKLAAGYLNDEQRRRFAAGVLPMEELLAAVREVVFAPLASFARYVRLTRADIEAASEDESDYKTPEYGTCEAGEVGAEEWATYEAIVKVAAAELPTPEVELRLHFAGWEEDRQYYLVDRLSVLVTVTIDEVVTISREYAASVD